MPVGFAAGPRNRATTSKIACYAEAVRMYALKAGLRLPLECSKLHPIRVDTSISFVNGSSHADAENVHKLIKDILFYHGATYVDKSGALCVRKHGHGNDRYTWGHYDYCYRDRPGVIVTIAQDTKAIKTRMSELSMLEFIRFEAVAHG
jgi:hypothetical protein